jgi:hypothetical protein
MSRSPRDHPQRRRLPTTRRTDQDHELTITDVQIDLLDRLRAIRIALRHLLKLDLRHYDITPSPRRR